MTPSQAAKQFGCKSLAQVARETKTPIRTLRDWFTSRPLVFKALCDYSKTKLAYEILVDDILNGTDRYSDYIAAMKEAESKFIS